MAKYVKTEEGYKLKSELQSVTSVNGQTGDVTVSSGSWNELSDRPFYEKKKLLVYSGNLKNNEKIDDFPIYVGKEYTLVVNGVATICVATQGYAYGEANGAVFDGTGAGFMSTGNIGKEYVYFSSGERPMDTNTYRVSLYEGTDAIVQLDEKFIPKSIARVEDIQVTSVNGQTGDVTVFSGSWNELSDRPFYEEESRTLVSPQTVTGYGRFYGEQIEIGKTYKVIVNGIEFVLVCANVYDCPGFWPEAFEGHFVSNNGFDSFGFFYYNGAYEVNYCQSETTRYTIAIYTVDEFVQLDEKFIPDTIARVSDISEQVQPDWNQSDETAVDFVKNRTHYRVPNENKIIVEGTFTSYADGQWNMVDLPSEAVIQPYVQYIVTIGDTTYTNRADSIGLVMPPGVDSIIAPPGTVYTGHAVVESPNTEYYIKVEDARDYIYTTIPEDYLPENLGKSGSGKFSWQFGDSTIASKSGATSFGKSTVASNGYAFAHGVNTTASGHASHSEGIDTTASGYGAHAEGRNTVASNYGSHAEGCSTEAKGDYAHSEGGYTKASSQYQHVEGKYNIEDTENNYAHIVGNGTSDTDRSNAHTLDWDGMGWFAGGLKVGGTGQDDESAVEVALKTDIPEIPVTSINGQTGDVVITIPEVPQPDNTLTVEGSPADAKAVGDAINAITKIPSCTTEDNGKFLRVSNGVAIWQSIINAEEVAF